MRRMYSQAELSAIIKEVFLEDVASGEIDLPAMIGEALPVLEEADLSNADVVVKTLTQAQANWSVDFGDSMVGLPTGITYAKIYNRFEVIGNILYLVLTYSLENTTASDVSTGNLSIDVTLPEEIAEKLIDISGVSAKEATSTSGISAFLVNAGDKSYPLAINRACYQATISNTQTANVIRVNLYTSSAVAGNPYAIGANTKQYASARTFLVLL